ncbi:YicC/YloC family endoribonuclease [Limisalsivibrio acetivorans]|uniref:YicC/YloC family endoribonuclease n=1 Tax=Limisalsivibrio acetivorans TaxID=1304888 RepID=UPI0003B6049D|nr:YicC/YloC family endoribonuclease [Limisalsivibrio acetivorans]
MNIRSMTGYGKAAVSADVCDVRIEMKSVNSKYLDLNIRMPRYLAFLEITLKNRIRELLERGKVDVYVDVVLKKSQYKPMLNHELLEGYLALMDEMKNDYGVKGEPELDNVLSLPDVIGTKEDDQIGELVKPVLLEAVEKACTEIDSMRVSEGDSLRDDLEERLNIIESINNEIDENRNDVYQYWYDKYRSRLKDITDGEITEDRIVQEAAMHAEKGDITEEVTRIVSHLKQFRETLAKGSPCGKKLDFLCQEFNREFNTIGSKSSKVDIINGVVQGKSELDRIREQVQNIV